MSDQDIVIADLLGAAPPARHVLEIGCGDGRFAAAYRLVNPLARYVGIERDGPSAAAAGRVDRLLVGDIETLTGAEIAGDDPFDLIILGDALEHARDPAAVLDKVRGLLAADGNLLAHVRNPAHWRVISALMEGHPGFPGGIASRLLPMETLAVMLRDHGLRRRKHIPCLDTQDEQAADRWRPALADLAEKMGIDRHGFEARSAAPGHAVVAARADFPAPPMMHIVTSAMAPRAMDARARLPAQHLRSAPDVHASYQERAVRLPTLLPHVPKILILQRAAPEDAAIWTLMAGRAIRQGWIVISEYDDHPDLIAQVLKWAPDRERWLPLIAAHAVQTSTPALVSAFGAHNPAVRAFPNTAFTLPALRQRDPGSRRIFYGALNRGDFSVALAHALAPAISAHVDASFTVVHDRAFFEALPTERKTFLPLLSYDDYLARIESNDIALLPLSGSEHELYKSDIKYVESASRGAAVIASSAVYQHSVAHERTGLIAPTLDDWSPALSRLLADEPLRRTLAANAWAEIRTHRMFSTQVGERVAWYRQLWADREALQASLLARAPWLAAADSSRG